MGVDTRSVHADHPAWRDMVSSGLHEWRLTFMNAARKPCLALVLQKTYLPKGDRLGLHTAYAWSRFVFVDDARFNGNNLPGAPAHYIRSALHYEHPSGFWLAPNIEWVPTSYVVNSENTARTEAYTLYNIRLGYDHKPWNLSAFFEARNLTDKDYISAVTVDDANGRFFAPGDGRSFYGGISWRWR